jgi:hypothetical protein
MSAMKHINALLTEREGYATRGLTERVASVDKELAALGWVIETAATQPVTEHAIVKKATKRTTH